MMDRPSPDHLEQVAAAFSRKALLYDAFGEDHPVLQRMRDKVRHHVLHWLRPGDAILELNAGTGADAVFFARLGHRVHATDLAPAMVNCIEAKIAGGGLEDRLSAERCSFTDLSAISGGPFQYVLSNMGGLNCVHDLGAVARQVRGVLEPGGVMTCVVMPPVCLWEIASVLRGDVRTATRRWLPGGAIANVEGVAFKTYYFSPRQVIRAFGPEFAVLQVQGLSVITPPADHKQFALRFAGLYRWLRAVDDQLADRTPFRGWGDFFIISLVYQPEGGR
jgi:ubiquinone/menaquinone biosynthesis C-methylase UbiE